MEATLARTWVSALDEVAADLLSQAGVNSPPVDALILAERLQIAVVFDADQQGRARHKRLAGASSIFLNPDDRPERLQWAAAHELGEVVAHRVAARAGAGDDLSPGLREQIANQIASRLLLPRAWFAADAQRLDGDVLELKSLYRTASHELIAWRLLDLPEPSIVTIFDRGCMTRRRSNLDGQSPPLSPMERACWRQVHHSGKPLEQSIGAVRVQGWPVHEPHWTREILRVRPLGESDSAEAW